jgi:hypothetical protein
MAWENKMAADVLRFKVVVGEDEIEIADLVEKYLAAQETIEDLKDDRDELQEELTFFKTESQASVKRLLRDVFTTACPVNDPNDPSWDMYLKLLASAGE